MTPATGFSVLSLVVAAASAAFTLLTYVSSRKTRRAEFLMELHTAFFKEETYKPLRALIDDETSQSQKLLATHIHEQSADLTDFLNFFELIAYFQEIGSLEGPDVEALAGYYLTRMVKNPALMQYISREDTSFEYLSRHIKKLRKP